MKRFAIALIALQVFVLSSTLHAAPAACTLCVGTGAVPSAGSPAVPLLLRFTADDLSTAAAIDTLSPEQRRLTTLILDYSLADPADARLAIEQKTQAIAEWARSHGPFAGLGVQVTHAPPTLAAYAIKRLAVTIQGLDAASRIVAFAQSAESLEPLFAEGANAYFDAIVLPPGGDVSAVSRWLTEKDPAKKIDALIDPGSPNVLFDLAQALAAGASRAYLNTSPDPTVLSALANFNRAMSGDYAYDSTSKTTVLDARGNPMEMPVLTFVRGEDLRTVAVPRGIADSPFIISLPTDRFVNPRRIDAAGEREVTDVGRKGGRFLIGSPAVREPFALAVEHAERPGNVTKESLEVATRRGITVEEIIRNHQAHRSYQESIQPSYIARNTTKLRFNLEGGEAIEAAISGDYFSSPDRASDWVWQDFFINGVRWKYGRIPELPLIQPEKVTQLPLDIHLTNDYRYELVRETEVLGYKTYEVRFEPPPAATAGELPLYRGTVWIDARTWARIRISMLQLNLRGEILSNEEQVDFQPFDRASGTPLTPREVGQRQAKDVLWLARLVEAQQVVSAAGRANVILRSTTFENFRINPPEFETLHQQAAASDARIVRETDEGLRYFEKRGDGTRVLKEGFDTSRLFMLGGIHHDAGLEYPVVPLGGIDYFNFNLRGTGIQTNVFFAGVVVAANATHPNIANTRINAGADFFAIALPTENSMYRNGEEQPAEAIKSVPASLTLRAGRPFAQFGKLDLSLGLAHLTYQRGEETAADFTVPSDTFVITPGVDVNFARRGYRFSTFYNYSRRTEWEPWGRPLEYSADQKSFSRFGASLGKSFYLPKFQRIGVDVNYLDGQRLDRFSKYELGFFGTQRVHGIRSGSVRAERAVLSHLSYGFVFSEQIRLEAFYDHALIDDATAGLKREPFQGVGIAGQMIGPYATLLRLDIGKSIGRNAQDGFVANIVFLKLF